jgi:hypothetical protein
MPNASGASTCPRSIPAARVHPRKPGATRHDVVGLDAEGARSLAR